MVELGCQDTDWALRNDKEVLNVISLRDGLILATLSIDKTKCGYLGYISGWFGALRGAQKVTDGRVRVSGYRLGRWKCQRF